MPPKVSKVNASETAPAPAVADGPLSALTAREQTIMLQCLLTVPGFPAGIKFDVEKVAQRMNLQNPRSVSNAWSVIKKKLIDFDEKDRKANGVNAKDEEADGQEEPEDANPTPKKRARTTKAAAASTAKDATPAKPKTTRRRIKKESIVAPIAGPVIGATEDDIEDEAEQTAAAGTVKAEGEADENGVESKTSNLVA